MARIYSHASDDAPEIDKDSVLNFFEERANKVDVLGPTRAVIYQDKNIDLAEKRDVAEKKLLLPLLHINDSSRVLDAGCGTGRWAEVVIPECAEYFGVDVSPGLIKVARERFGNRTNASFAVCAVDAMLKEKLCVDRVFTHVLSFGVFIYLNDAEVIDALRNYADLSAAGAVVMFREPVALQKRLTLLEHFSEDMDQKYSAIYRTEEELLLLISKVFGSDFAQIGSGEVYSDAALSNRAETKQKWFLWKRL